MFSGVQGRLRSLDIYRKLPSDLTEPTTAGAIVSILSTIIIVFLFMTELQEYIEIDNQSEMFVDVNRGERIQVNIDLLLPRLPCQIVSLDVQDVMGSHIVNVGGHLLKKKIKNGRVISEEVHKQNEHHDHHGGAHEHGVGESIDLDKIKKAFEEGEGCQLVGHIIVNKVPGNFHISSHAYGHILNQVFSVAGISTIDLSHKINHISFGEEKDIAQIMRKFKKGVLNPLDGTEKIKEKGNEHGGVMHQYYISVVPTTYVDVSGKEYYVHQFTVNSNEVPTHHLPALYFRQKIIKKLFKKRFDLSPVTVRFTQYRENFLHFLVQICAIVGGVFTVASIIDGMIHKSVISLLKKHQQGKLS